VRFVDEAEIDSRYYEKPYYLVPDGDEADEGYTVIRDALKQSRHKRCPRVGTSRFDCARAPTSYDPRSRGPHGGIV
jgi:hypothetical protein